MDIVYPLVVIKNVFQNHSVTHLIILSNLLANMLINFNNNLMRFEFKSISLTILFGFRIFIFFSLIENFRNGRNTIIFDSFDALVLYYQEKKVHLTI